MDEMWTFLGNKHKPLWIGYALDRKSKEVVDFNVGGRFIEMLSAIFKTVNSSAPSKVYTDYLVHYLLLVLCEVHSSRKTGNNSYRTPQPEPPNPSEAAQPQNNMFHTQCSHPICNPEDLFLGIINVK